MAHLIVAAGATIASLMAYGFYGVDNTVEGTSEALKERLGQTHGLLVDLDERLTPLLQGLSGIPSDLGHQIKTCKDGIQALIQTETQTIFKESRVLLAEAKSIAKRVMIRIAQVMLLLIGALSVVYWGLRYLGAPIPLALGLSCLGVAGWIEFEARTQKIALQQHPTPGKPTPHPNPTPDPNPAPQSKTPSIRIYFSQSTLTANWGKESQVSFTVKNDGTGDSTIIHCYILRSPLISPTSNSSWIIPSLPPGKSATCVFNVCPKDSSKTVTEHTIEILSSHQLKIPARITIRVPPRPISPQLMRSVTLRCKEWVYYAGGAGNPVGGKEETFYLIEGEYITGVRIYRNVVNRSMKFITNKRESKWYGDDRTGELIVISAPAQMGLQSFTCQYGLFWFWGASKGFKPTWTPIYDK